MCTPRTIFKVKRSMWRLGRPHELTQSQPTWLPCPGSYAWTFQDISSHVKFYRLAEESLAINMGRRTELGFVRHIWLFGGTYLDVSDISGYFVEHNVDLSDKSGYSVGHIWICRIHLAFWSDTSGRVGHIWLFCRTYLASDKSDFVKHIEPSQGLLYRPTVSLGLTWFLSLFISFCIYAICYALQSQQNRNIAFADYKIGLCRHRQHTSRNQTEIKQKCGLSNSNKG